MAWVLLITAGAFETGFAVMLKQSDGFSKIVPTILFAVFALASFGLLNLALRDLPVGTAYAVWTGIGAAGTAAVGIIALGEPADALRIAAISLIVTGPIGAIAFSRPVGSLPRGGFRPETRATVSIRSRIVVICSPRT